MAGSHFPEPCARCGGDQPVLVTMARVIVEDASISESLRLTKNTLMHAF